MSQVVDVPISTLAKIEQQQSTLTYEKLQRFCSSLGITLMDLLSQSEDAGFDSPVLARRSVSASGNSVQVLTPARDYEYLCADLRMKRMVPTIERVRIRDAAQSVEQERHAGEKFLFVLEGAIEVHLQFYSPVIVPKGQAIYFDGTMTHGYAAAGCEIATVLAVRSSGNPDFATGPWGLGKPAGPTLELTSPPGDRYDRSRTRGPS